MSPTLNVNATYKKMSRISRLPGYLTIQYIRFFVRKAGDAEEMVAKKILKVIGISSYIVFECSVFTPPQGIRSPLPPYCTPPQEIRCPPLYPSPRGQGASVLLPKGTRCLCTPPQGDKVPLYSSPRGQGASVPLPKGTRCLCTPPQGDNVPLYPSPRGQGASVPLPKEQGESIKFQLWYSCTFHHHMHTNHHMVPWGRGRHLVP